LLPKNQQEVIRLKFQHGLSYKEISTVTNLSVTNVGFLIHTGLKVLRERFGGVQPGDAARVTGVE
jgi:RNA polymerase sigma-70 factor (ECF subfamily)